MLEKITKLFKPRTFEGRVVETQVFDGKYDSIGKQVLRYNKVTISEIVGYDSQGKSMVSEYTIAHYRATVLNSQGEEKKFESYGRVPEVGETKKYHLRNEIVRR